MTVRLCLSLLLLTVPLALGGCTRESKANAQSAEQSGGTWVRTEVLGRRTIASAIQLTAALEPVTEVTLYSQVAERIVHFPLDNGDAVRKGQVIARVRSDSLRQAERQIGAEIESLDVQLGSNRRELARARTLARGNVITRQSLDQAEATYLANAARRKSLEASRQQIAINAGKAAVTAPFDGIIANRRLKLGDMASPQTPLCTLMAVDRLKLELQLSEAQVTRVKPGQLVRVQVDALPGRVFQAQLTRILPYVDPTLHTNAVEVTLGSGQGRLKPGMYARVEIELDRRTDVLVAPESALLLDTGSGDRQRQAFVVDRAGKARRRTVHLGARDGSYLEVLDGLSPGERIVTRGQHALSDGQTVQIQQPRKTQPEDAR